LTADVEPLTGNEESKTRSIPWPLS